MDPFFLSNLGSLTDHSSGENWTSRTLVRHTIQHARFLYDSGVRPGDNVLILHNSNNRFFADLFAVWLLGGCALCADAGMGSSEFERLVQEAEVRTVVIKGDVPAKLTGQTGLANMVDTLTADRTVTGSHPLPLDTRPNLDQPALILYTSGSTGDPKGVVHTFRTLQAKWFSLRKYVPLEHCENTLCLLPTHFGHGLICNSLYPLVHGKHVVLLPKFDMKNLSFLSDILQQYKITFMSSVPTVWNLVLRLCPPPKSPTLKEVHIGSSPLNKDLWQQVQNWTGTRRVWNTYGITETGSWIAGTSQDEVEPQDGLIGPGWDTDILISTRENLNGLKESDLTGLTQPRGEKGYVWVRTTSLMKGYFKREEQTNQVIFGSWFYTGDLGYLDERNRLFLVGRTRNEINRAGIKVSPEEVDVVLEKHPDILEACTFGVQDAMLNEAVAASVVFRSEIQAPLTIDGLKKWCSDKLSDYKVPSIWYQVKEIPRTPRGKIKRSDVAEFCQSLEPMG